MYIVVNYDQVADLPAAQHAEKTKGGRVILPLSVMKAANKSLIGVDFVTLEAALEMVRPVPVASETESPEIESPEIEPLDIESSESSAAENQESINPESAKNNE